MVFSTQVPDWNKEVRNHLRLELTTLSQCSQPRPGQHLRSRERQAPGVGMIMIAPCTQFYFQPPYLNPTHAVLIPKLIDGESGGEQPLVGPAEHLLHLLSRGGQKHADVLPGYTAVQVQQAQHA